MFGVKAVDFYDTSISTSQLHENSHAHQPAAFQPFLLLLDRSIPFSSPLHKPAIPVKLIFHTRLLRAASDITSCPRSRSAPAPVATHGASLDGPLAIDAVKPSPTLALLHGRPILYDTKKCTYSRRPLHTTDNRLYEVL